MIYLTVSALTKYIKSKLESDKHLVSIYLKGEISNFKQHSRGHLYFTIKDEGAQINAIMFVTDARNLTAFPKDGDQVLVKGKISLYEPSGSYSLQVSELKVEGIGELYIKYEQLKKEYEEKGYFLATHKQIIPKFPNAIGVVTSPTGAVILDIKNTIQRRYPFVELFLYPALVQGPDSAKSIARQIERANIEQKVDVLIVGRGGGSIEDLWGFNEALVIEAIFKSKIPIITAIGHETDSTISDFVGDLRAPTPTAAAELATPNQVEINDDVDRLTYQLTQNFKLYCERLKTNLVHLDQRLISPFEKWNQGKEKLSQLELQLNKHYQYLLESKRQAVAYNVQSLVNPEVKLKMAFERVSTLKASLSQIAKNLFSHKEHHFKLLNAQLKALNPLFMMDKGFVIVSKAEKIIKSTKQVELDDKLEITFIDGKVKAKVTEKEE